MLKNVMHVAEQMQSAKHFTFKKKRKKCSFALHFAQCHKLNQSQAQTTFNAWLMRKPHYHSRWRSKTCLLKAWKSTVKKLSIQHWDGSMVYKNLLELDSRNVFNGWLTWTSFDSEPFFTIYFAVLCNIALIYLK